MQPIIWIRHHWFSLLPFILAGCATVDPQPDYQRTAGLIENSTGHDVPLPDEASEAIASRVEELLDGGLTVGEAVQIGLINHPGMQAAWLDVARARADLVQSKLLSNPTLGVGLEFPAGGGLARLESSIAQNVADLWQIPVRSRVAEHDLNRAILQMARQAGQRAAEIKAAHARALSAEHLHELSESYAGIAHRLLETSEARRAAGAGSELDVTLARSADLQARLQVENARLERARARRQLAQLLGLTTNADDLELLDQPPAAQVTNLSPEAGLELARESRLDMQAAQQSVEMAAMAIELEVRHVFPTLEIGAGLERDARRAQPGRKLIADTARASIAGGGLTAPDIQPRSQRRRNTDITIGPSLSLELPIFDQNQAGIARAEYDYRQALLMYDALDRRLSQDVRDAVDRSATAARLLELSRRELIPLAENNLELSNESYRAGKASVLVVLEAQRFLLDSRRREIEARAEHAAALAEMERVIGLPLERLDALVYQPPMATRPGANVEDKP